MELTKGQINRVMQTLMSEMDYDPSYVITEEFATTERWGSMPDEAFKGLIGYTVELEIDGDHRHDGQMVEYDFTFISPKKKKTNITTDMCLVVGFNYHKSVTIK